MKGPLLKASALIGSVFAVRKVIEFSKASKALYEEQVTQETKLATIMKQRMNATDAEIQSIKDLASEQQKLGVIGDEVQLAGAQQVATFLTQTDAIKTLIPAMNNLIAQQNGLNATAEDSKNIGNMVGKVMQGQTEALKRVGISFSDADAKAIKYGTELERAAALAKVINDNVGNMNEALANTDSGKQKQLANTMGDLREEFGQAVTTLQTTVLPVLARVVRLFSNLTANLKVFSNTVAKVFGKQTKEAVETTTKSTEELTNATENQIKATKKMLGSYDKLDVIETPDLSDNSASTAEDDISSLISSFTDTQDAIDKTSDKLEEFFSAFKNGNYKTVGTTIAQNVSDAVSKIDWNSVYKKAQNFGNGLAEFLNGLYDGHFISSISGALAGALNTATTMATSFAKTHDWSGLGTNMAEGINTFFTTYDFKELGEGISAFIRGWKKSLITFLKKTDWAEVGKSIGELIGSIDWAGVVWDFLSLANAMLDAILKALVSVFKEAPIEATLISAFAVLKYTNLGKNIVGKIQNSISTSWKSMGGLKFDLGDWGAANLSEKLTALGAVATAAVAGWKIGNAIADAFEEPLSRAYTAISDFFTGNQHSGAELFKVEDWKNTGITEMESQLINLNSKIKEVTGNYKKERDARKEAFSNADETAKELEILAGKYLDLRSKEKLTADEEQKLKWYRDKMVELSPEIAEILDNTETSYKDMKDSLGGYINNLRTELKLQSSKKQLESVYDKQLEVEKQLKQYSADQVKLIQEEISKRESARQAYDTFNKEVQKQRDLVAKLRKENSASEEYDQANAKLAEMQTKASGLYKTWIQSVDKVNEIGGGYETLVNEQTKLNEEENYWLNVANDSKTATTNINNMNTATKNSGTAISAMANGFKGIPSTVKAAMEGAQNTVRTYTKADRYTSDFKNIQRDAKKGLEGVPSTVKALMEASNATIKANATAGEKSGEAYGKSVAKGVWKGFETEGIPTSVINQMKKSGAYADLFNSVPKLANGAVLPANKPFMAVVGDQTNGTNIEAPLDTIKQGVAEVIAQMGGGITGDIVLNIDGNELFKWTVNKNNDYKTRYGKSAY